jgi:hypothetical protein
LDKFARAALRFAPIVTDETTGPDPDDSTNTPPGDGGDDQGSNEPEPLTGQAAQDEIRRLRGENRSVRRERNTLRDRTKQLEDQGKTEVERERDRANTAERERDTERSKASKYEIAAEVGLPLRSAKRIQGGNREEMVEDAKALMKEMGEPDNGTTTDFHGGVRGPAVGRPKTMNDLIRQAAGRR